MTDADSPPASPPSPGSPPSPAGGSEHTYREIFAISQDAILIHDTEVIIEANEAALRMYGYPRDEFIGMKVLDISDEPEKTAEAIGRAMGGRKTRILMRRHRRKDGSTFPVEISGGTVEAGGRKTVCAIIRDMTRRDEEEKRLEELVERRTDELAKAKERLEAELADRKTAEEALLKSEGTYRALIEGLPQSVMIIQDAKVVFANGTAARFVGVAGAGELTGRDSDDFVVESEVERLISFREKRVAGGAAPPRYETSLRRADGSGLPVEIFASRIDYGGRPAVLVMHVDLTESRAAERAIRESEARYRSLFRSSRDAITFTSPDGRFLDVNDAALEMFGYTRDEMLELPVREHYANPDDRVRFLAEMKEKGRVDDFEMVFSRKDGTPRDCLISSIPYRGSGGDIAMYQNIIRDVTDRRKAERALVESEGRYRRLFEQSNDAVFIHTLEGALLDVNARACEMLGCGREELLGKSILELSPGDEGLRRMAEGVPQRFEDKMIRLDGATIDVDISARLIDPEKGIVQGIARDITARKLMEEEQRKAAKLESVGLLAGGIAHDFNNIMSAITGNLALAKLLVAADPYVSERLSEAEAAAARVKGLTQQLLTFSKGGAPVTEAASIADIVEQSAVFALRGSNVDLNLAVAEDLRPAEVDRGQIGQVVDNLVINAKQAMAEGGTLHVRIENARGGPGSGLPLAEGDYVRLTIADEGVGIPPENLDRIFDPYFTTKHKGSGLGLAVCYAIVRKHEGHMAVQSEPGAGATFTVYLPATTGPAGEAAPSAPADLVRGEGRVLLMDDEEPILAVGREILIQLGYQVETAISGAEVVEKFRAACESAEPFDAVLMDLTVRGGMGGREAMEKLLEIDPGVRALVSSGYSNDPVMTNFAAHGFAGVVPKPYDVVQMSQALRDAVGGAAGAAGDE